MLTPLQDELERARQQTDSLFALVRPDSMYERPIPERHRIVFYLGHLEAFDWNLLAKYALEQDAFHPTFDQLFAFGIDPGEGNLPSDRPSDWPRMGEVVEYVERTRQTLDENLQSVPEEIISAAIEHRLMHAETLAYILHQLDSGRKLAPSLRPAPGAPPPRQRMVEVVAGEAELGRDSGPGFGWDNEYDAHSAYVPAFSIGKYKVTNREYLEFVRAGGPVPFFWVEQNGEWFYRAMFGAIPLPLDWPVYVTMRQAEDYTKWRGGSLPTEAQFHRAAAQGGCSQNVDFRYWDPIAVSSDDGMGRAPAQMTGNGWEWTRTMFAPFRGFKAQPYYSNYSEPFFDGEHFVLKGGSPRTAARLLRPSFRNWFRPSYPYVYATFRVVEG